MSGDDDTQIPGGLRTQLLVSLAVLLVGTLALVALAFVQLLERHVRSTEIERTFQLANQLADTPTDADLEPTVDHLMRHHAQIVGASLELSGAGKEKQTSARRGDIPSVELPNGRGFQVTSLNEEQILVTQVERPAADAQSGNDGSTAHRALVARTLEPAFDRVRQMRNLLLAYLAVDALFVLIVGYALLTYLVVRPIRAIGVATRRAARGDLASHIDLQPANEFGEVARSFNDMLDELRDNRRQLRERIEELDAAYTELEETQQNLIRSEKLASVGRLAAGVAHEIGNPLSAVTGYLDMLEDEELDAETRRDILERSRNQLQRIHAIIRDLLDFSRQETETDPEPVDIAECIREAIDLVEPQPRTRGVDITVELDDNLPPVRADAAQMTQVIVNLLMNAADAIHQSAQTDAPAGDDTIGSITITAAQSSTEETDTVELTVTDDGPGISAEDQANIFDPFFTTKEPGEGTGLGLAVVHRIVERHHGDISVTSPLPDTNHGTRFTVRLPTASETGE